MLVILPWIVVTGVVSFLVGLILGAVVVFFLVFVGHKVQSRSKAKDQHRVYYANPGQSTTTDGSPLYDCVNDAMSADKGFHVQQNTAYGELMMSN